MMLYDFACYDCEAIYEDVEQSIDEEHKIDCPKCGKRIGQFYHPPEFHLNQSVSDYFDEGLGLYVPSKSFREDAMKAKGLTPHEFNPKMKKAHDEARYIGKAGGTATDRRKVLAEAAKDVKRERIRESLSGNREEIAKTASQFGLTA